MGLEAAGALLGYAKLTQGQSISHIRSLQVYSADQYVRMDAATRRNLEITQTLRGEPAPTLLSLLDTCATNMGSRLLSHWLHHPLRDRTILRNRLAATEQLQELHRAVHDHLKPCVDVERITARIALNSARPRDLSGLRDTLLSLPQLHDLFGRVGIVAHAESRNHRVDTETCPPYASLLHTLADAIQADTTLATLLQGAIKPEPSSAGRCHALHFGNDDLRQGRQPLHHRGTCGEKLRHSGPAAIAVVPTLQHLSQVMSGAKSLADSRDDHDFHIRPRAQFHDLLRQGRDHLV